MTMPRLPEKIKQLLQKRTGPKSRGQSFVELALIIPIILLILVGTVEISMFIGRYLDMLDLTREAARFASVRDPFDDSVAYDFDCATINFFDFYWDTSCVFSPPGGSVTCWDPAFCNGLNPYFVMDPALDDIVISVYTLRVNPGGGTPFTEVSDVHPAAGYWAWSSHDPDTAHNDNWARDCAGNVVRTAPHFTEASVEADLDTNAPENKGYVAVELYYCYDQVLSLPLFTIFVPDPLQIHVYTLMPLPAAQPTPTPRP